MALIVVRNNRMRHHATIHNPAIVISIHNADRSRATRLPIRLRVLLPLRILANPIDWVFPKHGASLITVIDVKNETVSVVISVRVSALAGREACLPGLSLGNSNVNLEVPDGGCSIVEARAAVDELN